MSKPLYAEIALDKGLDRPLDYTVPASWETVEVGMRVEVPLQNRLAKGTVVALKNTTQFKELKPIARIVSEKAAINPELFHLALWMAKYYCTPLAKVLKIILPSPLRDEKVGHKMQSFIRPLVSKNQLAEEAIALRKRAPVQATALDLLLQTPSGLFLSQMQETGSISLPTLQALAKKNLIQIEKVQVDRSPLIGQDYFPTQAKRLNPEQEAALAHIVASCQTFQTHLLHGITGSGKTEIYLQAIEHVLSLGQGVIFLVPEIGLTSQMIERLRSRFTNETIAILHSALSMGERHDAWHAIASGKAKIVIGARSALFSPVPHLGMIIVDEEHEASYKQSEEAPKYHARDLAVVRGKFVQCPVILGSATPSLESYTNALTGKYQLHELSVRADNARLPTVHLVDMQKEGEKNKGNTLFSQPLIDKIADRLAKGEQILLFLNRRGYHTLAKCPHCGFIAQCPHCSLTLTYHYHRQILSCHLCDEQQKPPLACPQCKHEGPLHFQGVGTEKVERMLQRLFPSVRTLRLDADTTRHKGSHEQIFKAFRSGKADILVGTQMIAKGHHFPLVTLVGVIGVDGSLHIPDFRASENVFQLLTQVAGRAGRGELPGEVILQTYLPHHPLFQKAAAQDYKAFYDEEIEVRKLFGFPPFARLIKCSFSGKEEPLCEARAAALREELIRSFPPEVTLFPVVTCGYTKIKGRYRFQFLIKTPQIAPLLQVLKRAYETFDRSKGVSLSIDVDPLSIYF